MEGEGPVDPIYNYRNGWFIEPVVNLNSTNNNHSSRGVTMGSFFIRRLLFSMLVLGVLQSSTVFNVDCWAQIGLNRRATTPLADLSGMVWVGGNRFIAVHDAKVEDEFFKPRVAALR